MKELAPQDVSCAPSTHEDEELRALEAQYEEDIHDGGQSVAAVLRAMKEHYGLTILWRQTGRMAALGFLSPTRKRLPAVLHLRYDGERWHFLHDEHLQDDLRDAQQVVEQAAENKIENFQDF